ncbi:MAG: hypothetical protein C0483_13595 [Pirellula sp.]|nr:hypothetical protein [Pirellula sp.]
MQVTGIAYYMSAVLLAAAGMLSLITVVPGRESTIGWAMAGAVAAAVVCFASAIGLQRLPADHWAHRSRPLRLGMAGAAGLLTVLTLLAV